MQFAKVFLSIVAAALLVTGCGRMKNEATEALGKIESSVAALKDEGTKYAPVAYQGVESTLKTLKDSLAKGEYKTVLAGTPYEGLARQWKADPAVAGSTNLTCKNCHTPGRLLNRAEALKQQG